MALKLKMRKTYRIDKLKSKMSKVISWTAIVVFISITFTVLRNLQNLNKSKSRIVEAEMRLEKLNKENEELRNRVDVVKSLEFKEAQIRNNLGLVKENEIIVILPDPETVKKFAPVEEPQNIEPPKPYWKKWLELFV